MAKHNTLLDSSLQSTQPVATYVRVGRGMIKVTQYEKQDTATRQTDRDQPSSIHSFDSSQPHAPSSRIGKMPAWVSKFKRVKKDKKASVDTLDQQSVDQDPSTRTMIYRLAHPNDMWTSIAQLESELVARYGRGAVPQLEALRERMQNEYEQPVYQQIEWADDPPNQRSRVRTRTETLPSRTRPVPRAFVDDLDVCSVQSSPIQPSISTSIEEGDSDDAAAYLQALGLEPSIPKEAKPKTRVHAQSSNSQTRHRQPARSATLPTHPTENSQDALIASIVNNPSPEVLEQYMASRHPLSRSYYTTPRAHSNEALDPSVSSRSASPMHTPDSPAARSQSSRRDLPPRPPPPNTSVPYTPRTRLYTQDSPVHHSPASFSRISPRPQQSPMSLTSAYALRVHPNEAHYANSPHSSYSTPTHEPRLQPPHGPKWSPIAHATPVFRSHVGGGQGTLSISVEERMAELTTPGGGRGVGDDEVGFGLGYYVSVEMRLEGEVEDHRVDEGSVPVATMSVPLPTTLGEIAIVFRERKDIRKALS
ncbi:hypothetical protein RSOL_437170 [Rhizoctonia solani AG-3 Rhs1AP]|uniref:Uncharacterized protein n=1 Tax=Rhizoctonia solani AG-3 Rhs1AP TaxID=1086054 RepID=X8JKA2_9AGAM|nr:hypothetical protein RSOL_437170 [Rhizoctonia solani AG-3 Rhs1AP]